MIIRAIEKPFDIILEARVMLSESFNLISYFMVFVRVVLSIDNHGVLK